MLKNLLDACGAAVAFFCVGYAFAFGGETDPNSDKTSTTFIGTDNFFGQGEHCDGMNKQQDMIQFDSIQEEY